MLTHETEVNVSSELHAVWQLLGNTTDHEQEECLLHILMAKDFWSNAAGEPVIHITLPSHCLQRPRTDGKIAALFCLEHVLDVPP